MISNQSNMPQSADMPGYYQQMQSSPNQANLAPQAVNKQPAPAPLQYHCCVDFSQMHHFPYMHDFHHMHHYHPMMDGYHPMMDGYHPMMDDFHPMMDDFHPMMYGMWDEHMFFDQYDGWELTELDYHHAWFHPMMHMHHHPHHFCFPVTCQPTGEIQKQAAIHQP